MIGIKTKEQRKPVAVVTGGAGFIGSHLVNRLVADGYQVYVMDCLLNQVRDGSRDVGLVDIHGTKKNGNAVYSFANIQFIEFMIERYDLKHIDRLYHLAAKVGVGESAYKPVEYMQYNIAASYRMLDRLSAFISAGKLSLGELHVASSMSVYGEGKLDGGKAVIHQQLSGNSIYAIQKLHQEQLCLSWAKAKGIPAYAYRFFNVYGPGQSLTNGYTGLIAIMLSALAHNMAPIIYEDGLQSRDFIYVSDIVDALAGYATEKLESTDSIFNVGTGKATTVLKLWEMLSTIYYGKAISITPSGERRYGDIRHCISTNNLRGFAPKISLQQGLETLVRWYKYTKPNASFSLVPHAELKDHGLLLKDTK